MSGHERSAGSRALERAAADAMAWLVPRAVEEDVGAGDWTTLWAVPERSRGRAEMVARQEMVVAGTEEAVRVFETVDPELRTEVLAEPGELVAPGAAVVWVEGATRSILTAERTALNFLGHLSGVATLTRRFAERLVGTGARVVDTRKTTPGWRALEKRAVRSGGGVNHRLGLHDMALVKENHVAAAGGLRAAVAGVRAGNDRGLPVEVEVTSLAELREVVELGVDRILLDNMEPSELEAAVAEIRSGEWARAPELEASGNVTLDNVRRVGATGVDLVSVGALTHSAPAADVALELSPVE